MALAVSRRHRSWPPGGVCEPGWDVSVTSCLTGRANVLSIRTSCHALLWHCASSRYWIVELHLRRVQEQIALQQNLAGRLRSLAGQLSAGKELSATEIMKTIGVMTMTENIEKYYTAGQMQELRQRREQLGEERIHQAEAEWPVLIAQIRAAMERGDDPAGPDVPALGRRWGTLIREFTGGNPGIEHSLNAMYRSEQAVSERAGLDPDLLAYVQQAMTAG
ncbi:MAG: TipAS antibiotic-recognition domain-containing protein [Chloroflexota bacterium]